MNDIPRFSRKRAKLVNGLKDLIKYTELKDAVMVEVGSYAGESTALFAESGRFKTIYAVDPWKNGYDETDITSSKHSMAKIEGIFDQRTAVHEEIKKMRMLGDDAAEIFQDKSLDLVYIDGCHQYEAVKNDIQKWFPKVKSGGFIAGHDFVETVGVVQAVTETLGQPEKTFKDTSWILKV